MAKTVRLNKLPRRPQAKVIDGLHAYAYVPQGCTIPATIRQVLTDTRGNRITLVYEVTNASTAADGA